MQNLETCSQRVVKQITTRAAEDGFSLMTRRKHPFVPGGPEAHTYRDLLSGNPALDRPPPPKWGQYTVQ